MATRKGRNTRLIRESLSAQCRAYRQATDASGSRYDGSHGHRATDGSWRTFVVSGGWIRSTDPLVTLDGAHNAIVHRIENPIKTEVVIDPFDAHFAKRTK